MSQNNWRAVFALAGLPSLPRVLPEAKSYSERLFAYASIEQLPDPVASQALSEPAATEQVSWDPEALLHLVAQAAGYPYFLQHTGGVAAVLIASSRSRKVARRSVRSGKDGR